MRFLHIFDYLSGSLEPIIDDVKRFEAMPKWQREIIWKVYIRASSLGHAQFRDNLHSHFPFRDFLCSIGRHDYGCYQLIRRRDSSSGHQFRTLSGEFDAILLCGYCGAKCYTNIMNKEVLDIAAEQDDCDEA
jgi:hypothetical protein